MILKTTKREKSSQSLCRQAVTPSGVCLLICVSLMIKHSFTYIRMIRVTFFFFSCFAFFLLFIQRSWAYILQISWKLFSVFSYRKWLGSRETDNLMARKAGHPWKLWVARALAISVLCSNWGLARKQVKTDKPVEQLKQVSKLQREPLFGPGYHSLRIWV